MASADLGTTLPSGVNLAAYFERIGFEGPAPPTLETLNAIILAHTQRIPFENLDVLLELPISIEPAAIEEKLVTRRRGGYCFEHNALLSEVLTALGYELALIGARSRYQLLTQASLPRSHVLLRVELEGASYLVDVGFGGLSPTAALPLLLDARLPTPHEPRRIIAEGTWDGLNLRSADARLVHQAYFAEAWHDLFELTLEHMPRADREMANWYTSAHPRSHFRNGLMVARATSSGRITLRDRELTTRDHAGQSTVRQLQSRAELLAVLDSEFGLELPSATRFDCPAWADAP